ncbi:MAG: AlpA family phage regulatory protein [Rickettsiales bacterium]
MTCDNSPSLPATGLIRLDEVLEFIPVSRSTWWLGVKDGRFPAPVKLGKRIRAWRAEDIHALMQTLPQAGNNKTAASRNVKR